MREEMLVVVFIIVFVGGIFGSLAFEKYNRTQCTKIALEKNTSIPEIIKLCEK